MKELSRKSKIYSHGIKERMLRERGKLQEQKTSLG